MSSFFFHFRWNQNFGRMSSAAPSAPAGFRLRVLVVCSLHVSMRVDGHCHLQGPRRKKRPKAMCPIYLVYTDEVKRKNATFQVRPKRCFQGIFLLRWFDGAFQSCSSKTLKKQWKINIFRRVVAVPGRKMYPKM